MSDRAIPTLLLFSVLVPAAAQGAVPGMAGLVDAQLRVPGLKVELKYATADNFMHRNLYGKLRTCYLQPDAAAMLADAQRRLTKREPGLHLLAYDCARPRSVQVAMWAVVKDTPQAPYVANPYTRTGSIHNYGCAIDLTIAGKAGKPLDMGTPYDFFGDLAHITNEAELVRKGRLTAEQHLNRLLLRDVMTAAGFQTVSNEWWHFNCAGTSETRQRYKMIP